MNKIVKIEDDTPAEHNDVIERDVSSSHVTEEEKKNSNRPIKVLKPKPILLNDAII